MKIFLSLERRENGAEVKLVKNRIVSLKELKTETGNPTIVLGLRKIEGGSPNTEVIRLPLSKDAALALAILLNDYFDRVEPSLIKSYRLNPQNSPSKNSNYRKRPGNIVLTSTGKTGRTYHDDKPIEGKVKVYIINDEFNLTGENLLCAPDSLQLRGFID